MSKKIIVASLGIFLMLVFTWWFYPSEDELLLNEARKIKEKNPDKVTFDGFLEPEYPKASENKSLYGVDSNKNGVRDDVEIWINRSLKTYNERMVARQYAGDLQYALEAAVKNTSESLGHAASVRFTTSSCVHFIILDREEAQQLMLKLRTITYNEKVRREILKNFMYEIYSVKSVVEGMASGEGYKGCNFKIENEIELKRKYLKR